MGNEENKEVVRKYIDKTNECIKTPNEPDTILKLLSEHVSPDHVLHTTAGDMSLEQDIQMHIRMWMAFPDTYYKIEDMFGEDDSVFARFSVTATHTGTFRGVLPTGIKLNLASADCFKVKEGKVTECWGFSDMLEVYRQLGVITSMREIVDKFNKSQEV